MAYDLKTEATNVTGTKRVKFALCANEKTLLVISANLTAAYALLKIEHGWQPKPKFSGVCFREGDILVFATEGEVIPTRRPLLSKLLKDVKYLSPDKIEVRTLDPADADGAGTGGASAVKLSAQWKTVRDTAVAEVGALVGALKTTGHGDAAKAGAVVGKLADGLPAGLDAVLSGFEEALASGDAKKIETARARAKGDAAACLSFLEKNQRLIALCEKNPFGAAVAISEPLSATLTSVNTQLG